MKFNLREVASIILIIRIFAATSRRFIPDGGDFSSR